MRAAESVLPLIVAPHHGDALGVLIAPFGALDIPRDWDPDGGFKRMGFHIKSSYNRRVVLYELIR